MAIFGNRKLFTRALVAAWVATAAAAGTSAATVLDDGEAPTRPYSAWFAVNDQAALNWSVDAVGDGPFHIEITRRGTRAEEAAHHVMVLYPRRSSAYNVAISKMLSMFDVKRVSARFTIINFDRRDEPGHAAVQFAKENNVDLIYTMGSESTAWLWNNFKGGEIPVVSVTSKDPVMLGQATSYDQGTGVNFAFTSLNMPVEAQIAYVNQLRPDLKNLAVLVDANNVSAMETQARPIIDIATKNGVRALSLEIKDPEKAREELASLVSEAVETMRLNDVNLENSLFWITGSTAVFREIETINKHSDRVPVLSVVPEVVKEGDNSAALSIGISFESNAHLAAIYGMRVLKENADPGALPVGVVSPPDIAINFRRARDIGLSVPFSFVEGASFIYDYDGRPVRARNLSQ